MAKKIAVIGASYLQMPLIRKANELGYETHAFAWADGAVGAEIADHFYPISIVEKDRILEKCREIGIDGICTIASDLAVLTVSYVAEKMGLAANPMDVSLRSTNKHLMRRCFEENRVPSPRSILYTGDREAIRDFRCPLIVKPTDRSGSRGITKIQSPAELDEAVDWARGQGFCDEVLVEEFAGGDEYSIECISFEGTHQFLSVTKKYTTGAPFFVERGHIEPAPVSPELEERIRAEVFHALDSLGIQCGASHSEMKIESDGTIRFIEIGSRMGGDFIGSDLVQLSTGYDFVKAVLDTALGIQPEQITEETRLHKASAVRFIFGGEDVKVLDEIREKAPGLLRGHEVHEITDTVIRDSSERYGYFILQADTAEELEPYMPEETE